jgi:hypothetical protein
VLTLAITVLATAYFVVPELLSRLVLSAFVVRKSVTGPRTEEVARASLWALFPLSIAWLLRKHLFYQVPDGSRAAVKLVFGGLYNDTIFRDSPGQFFHAVTIVSRANVALLSRAYLIVIVGSILVGLCARRLGRFRAVLGNSPGFANVLLTLILPRISEWHLALSSMLLVDADRFIVEIDVMTRGDQLYRGTVAEKAIAPDGSLQTLILTSAHRYLRDDFLRDRSAYTASTDKNSITKPRSDKYWRQIPGKEFLIVGADISSVNVRHVYTSLASVEPMQDANLNRLLQEVIAKLDERISSGSVNVATKVDDAPDG